MPDAEPSAPDPRADRGTPQYRRALIALFCAGLGTFAQMYSPQGLLPEIAREFGVGIDSSSWAIGATTIGVAVGVLPWARLSDRIGRVPAMRISMIAAAVLGLAAPLAPGFAWFITIRAAGGFALAGLAALAVIALSETVRPQVFGGAVGSYIAGTALGGLSGRIVAGLSAELLGWRWGVASVAILAALATFAFLALMPPTAVRPGPGLPVIRAVAANLGNLGVLVLVAQAFLLMGCFVAAYNYLAFRLEAPPFELSLAQVSWLFLSYFAGMLTSKRVWRLTRRWSPTQAILLSLGAMLVGLALTLTPWLAAVIVGLVIFTGAFFAAHSIGSGLVGFRSLGRPEATQAMPLYNLGYYSGSSLLGWFGGVAFAWAGWAGTATMIAAGTVLAGALAWGYARGQAEEGASS